METSNISHNFTSNTELKEDSQAIVPDLLSLIQVISITCYSIIFILGSVGNGLVIWIAGFKMKKMVNTIWFLNMTMVDFAFDILLPFQIVESILQFEWPFGRIMCKTIYTVVYLNMLVCTSFVVIISIDCCISAIYPVWAKKHRTPRLGAIISIATWLLCLGLSFPYVSFYDIRIHDFNENKFYCDRAHGSWDKMTIFDYNIWKERYNTMVIIRFLSMFLIPFSVVLFCFCLIKINRLSVAGHLCKIMITNVLCFFCCWFPFHFLSMLEIMDAITDWTTYEIVLEVSYCLAYFNSCLKPIFYVFIGCGCKMSMRLTSVPVMLENAFTEKKEDFKQSHC